MPPHPTPIYGMGASEHPKIDPHPPWRTPVQHTDLTFCQSKNKYVSTLRLSLIRDIRGLSLIRAMAGGVETYLQV